MASPTRRNSPILFSMFPVDLIFSFSDCGSPPPPLLILLLIYMASSTDPAFYLHHKFDLRAGMDSHTQSSSISPPYSSPLRVSYETRSSPSHWDGIKFLSEDVVISPPPFFADAAGECLQLSHEEAFLPRNPGRFPTFPPLYVSLPFFLHAFFCIRTFSRERNFFLSGGSLPPCSAANSPSFPSLAFFGPRCSF